MSHANYCTDTPSCNTDACSPVTSVHGMTSTENDDVRDVVVVGAGISGLAAAHKLIKSGVRHIAVVEAKGLKSVQRLD